MRERTTSEHLVTGGAPDVSLEPRNPPRPLRSLLAPVRLYEAEWILGSSGGRCGREQCGGKQQAGE